MIADIIAAACMLTGSLLALTASIGIVRFRDTLSRMHAATKPQTFGMILILIAVIIRIAGHPDGGMLVLTGLFALITAPVIAQRVGRLAYREQRRGEILRDESQTPRNPH
ncbi:MAG: monovalent cation/H(+) antiporter subunit G [Gordonia sp. (in: high G+C Gram-positive bacteria)]|uniref:monovalent cation/H(+) antiporter subunit G n=1 Tax=Gordonia sp. (in: high G+C Gram-positive bacteria) TaxID=84139 RepID=UPI0039E68B4A